MRFHVAESEALILSKVRLSDGDELRRAMLRIRDERECTPTETCYYNSIKSAPFTLGDLGFSASKTAGSTLNTAIKCQKQHSPLYVWGQMHFWYKQTVEKPDTSLVSVRRGCMYLPFIDCCFAKKRRHPIIKPYDEEARSFFVDTLQESPHQSWSSSMHWTFKGSGGDKTYGSPFLDHYLDETVDLHAVVKQLKTWRY